MEQIYRAGPAGGCGGGKGGAAMGVARPRQWLQCCQGPVQRLWDRLASLVGGGVLRARGSGQRAWRTWPPGASALTQQAAWAGAGLSAGLAPGPAPASQLKRAGPWRSASPQGCGRRRQLRVRGRAPWGALRARRSPVPTAGLPRADQATLTFSPWES